MPICSTVQLHLCIYRKLGNAKDSDNMEYTEDAIDNMILEFSGDLYKHESKIKCLFVLREIYNSDRLYDSLHA
jgi:hypothetical protein